MENKQRLATWKHRQILFVKKKVNFEKNVLECMQRKRRHRQEVFWNSHENVRTQQWPYFYFVVSIFLTLVYLFRHRDSETVKAVGFCTPEYRWWWQTLSTHAQTEKSEKSWKFGFLRPKNSCSKDFKSFSSTNWLQKLPIMANNWWNPNDHEMLYAKYLHDQGTQLFGTSME